MPRWVTICLFCLVANTGVSDVTEHPCSSALIGGSSTIDHLDFDLRQANKTLDYALARRERLLNTDYNQQALDRRVQHSRWMTTYYGLFGQLRGGSTDQIEATIRKLIDSAAPNSVAGARRLAELFAYVEENTALSGSIPRGAYEDTLVVIRRDLEEKLSLELRTDKREQYLRRKLRLISYEARLASITADLPLLQGALKEFKQTLRELKNAGGAQLQYLEASLLAELGASESNESALREAASLLETSLESFGVKCNLAMAGKAGYLLTDVYLKLAVLPRVRREPISQHDLKLAIRSAYDTETSVSLLYTPLLWKKVHLKSAEVYELAALEGEGSARTQRSRYQYLADRAYLLAMTH